MKVKVFRSGDPAADKYGYLVENGGNVLIEDRFAYPQWAAERAALCAAEQMQCIAYDADGKRLPRDRYELPDDRQVSAQYGAIRVGDLDEDVREAAKRGWRMRPRDPETEKPEIGDFVLTQVETDNGVPFEVRRWDGDCWLGRTPERTKVLRWWPVPDGAGQEVKQ